MDKLFGSLKDLVKIQGVVTDNNVFRLHYKVTVPILVAFSVLVTSRQYIGDPIDCISKDDIPLPLLDTFCWIHSTFSVQEAWFKEVGVEVPYPGVEKYSKNLNQTKVYHAYYQWVCFVLFLQAIMFYLPRHIWKSFEGGKIRHLVLELNSPILGKEKRDGNRKLLTDYFVASFNKHVSYAMAYFVCEFLNIVNVIGQMYLMDDFLGGEFSTYGAKVLTFTEWDWSVRYDPMIRVFPRLTKCTFHRYGSSGDVQKHDAMCILPINIINEKIYVFLWFWFVLLAIFSCLAFAYRALLYISPKARGKTLMSRVHLAKKEHIKTVLSKCNVGDWFLLDLLAKNLNPINFRDLVHDLAYRIEGKDFNGI